MTRNKRFRVTVETIQAGKIMNKNGFNPHLWIKYNANDILELDTDTYFTWNSVSGEYNSTFDAPNGQYGFVPAYGLVEILDNEAQDTQSDCMADRHNDGKEKLSFLFDAPAANRGKAQVKEYGATKYSRGNWKKGLPYTEVIDSLARHLQAFISGDDLDPESGLPHVDHIQANAEFLSEFFHTRPDLDDRVK